MGLNYFSLNISSGLSTRLMSGRRRRLQLENVPTVDLQTKFSKTRVKLVHLSFHCFENLGIREYIFSNCSRIRRECIEWTPFLVPLDMCGFLYQ